jgi:hypothetical protein
MTSEMKIAIGSNRAPTTHRHPKRRLHENFYIANQMKPYANRLRVRLADLDLCGPNHELQLEANRTKMTEFLVKKKIRSEVVQRAVALALDIAATHQFEGFRRNQNLDRLAQSERARQRLIQQLRYLAETISKLPPPVKGKLNKIIAEQEWANFDTEMLGELIQTIIDALSKSSPAVTANKAVNAIREWPWDSADPVIANIIRTAPPAILELWETIPAETRTQLEAGFRNWQPPARRSMMEFLSYADFLLETFQPRSKRGRLPAIERRFAQRVARIWGDLGLHVGRAYDGSTNYRGTFQRFSGVALSAVRDDSKVSNRQITNLKRRSGTGPRGANQTAGTLRR